MYAGYLVMQLRFLRLRRLAWVILSSAILRMFTKEYILKFQVRVPFSFFRSPFYKILLKQKDNSLIPVGMYGKYPWSERGKGFYFQYCFNLKRRLETHPLSFCSLSTLGPLFQVLCSFLAFWTSWQDHILWFWSLKLTCQYLKFLPRTMAIFS